MVCVNLTEPADGTVTMTTILQTDTVSGLLLCLLKHLLFTLFLLVSDFSLSANNLVFTMDGPIQQCSTLSILTDNAVEQNEIFLIQLGGSTIVIGSPGTTTISITDTTRKFTKKVTAESCLLVGI